MSENTPDPDPTERTAEIAAVSDGATTLLVADFDDTDTAWEAYEALRSVEDGRHAIVESALDDVVAKEIRALAEEAEEE